MPHTPAPWQIIDMAPPITIWKDDGQGDGPAICLVGDNFTDYSDDENCDELEANARLIAAAPELLAALEEIAQWVFAPDERGEKDVRNVIKTANSAIAKAKG